MTKTRDTVEIEDKYLAHINASDPLQIVIRGHLHLEAELNQLILFRFASPEALDLSDLSFPRRLDLAVALGCLNAADKPPYLFLNSLRNKLAHDLNYDVTPKDLRDLINCLSPKLRGIHKTIVKANPQLKEDFVEHLRWCISILLQFLEAMSRNLRANQSLKLTE